MREVQCSAGRRGGVERKGNKKSTHFSFYVSDKLDGAKEEGERGGPQNGRTDGQREMFPPKQRVCGRRLICLRRHSPLFHSAKRVFCLPFFLPSFPGKSPQQ